MASFCGVFFSSRQMPDCAAKYSLQALHLHNQAIRDAQLREFDPYFCPTSDLSEVAFSRAALYSSGVDVPGTSSSACGHSG